MKEYKGKKISKFQQEKSANMTDEDRQHHGELVKAGQANRTDEQRRLESERKSISQTKRFANMTQEEKDEFGDSVSKGLNDMSPEAKQQQHERQSESLKKRYINLSEEEKIIHNQPLVDYNEKRKNDPEEAKRFSDSIKEGQSKVPEEVKKRVSREASERMRKRYEDPKEHEKQSINALKQWENKTPEQKQETVRILHEGLSKLSRIRKAFIKIKRKYCLLHMPEEKKQLRCERISSSLIETNSKLTYEDKVAKDLRDAINHNERTKHQHIFPTYATKTERQFYELMQSLRINIYFQYYNIIEYFNFHELFPNNPIVGFNYVSPFHKWDFLIIMPKNKIFIDIDGSAHFIAYDCIRKRNILFYDSQRIYKTDNLPAFIVQCPNDDIYNFNVKIKNVHTDEFMTLDEFIKYLENFA